MTEKLSNVTLSYTTKTGEHKTKTIKVEQGLVINFNNKNGEYENSYSVNKKGQVVAKYGPNNRSYVVKQIETTEAEINRLTRIEQNNKDGGLTQKDFDTEEEKRVKSVVAEQMKNGKVPFSTQHPILAKILPKFVQDLF